jgi:hypothetical protein
VDVKDELSAKERREIARREKQRLRELAQQKKENLEKMRNQQNAVAEADDVGSPCRPQPLSRNCSCRWKNDLCFEYLQHFRVVLKDKGFGLLPL